MNKIPEGGFIISATGSGTTTVGKAARIGARVFEKRAKAMCIAYTPEVVFNELKNTVKAQKLQYDELYQAVAFVDFSFLVKLDAAFGRIINVLCRSLENFAAYGSFRRYGLGAFICVHVNQNSDFSVRLFNVLGES